MLPAAPSLKFSTISLGSILSAELFSELDAAALDRTNVSERKPVFVVAETAKSLGQNIDALPLNTKQRLDSSTESRTPSSDRYANIKAEFQGNVPLVVHWDGKLIQHLTGKEKVDRLPVLVSGKGVSQLLTVAKLPTGTGKAQADAVFEAIEDWGIANSIRAMCFDTSSSNTGRLAGACVLLEQKLAKELLSFAYRHHIMELVIGEVFKVCMGAAPEVPLFKRFQSYWGKIDTAKYEPGILTDEVSSLIEDIKEDTLNYANKHLEQRQPTTERTIQRVFRNCCYFSGWCPCQRNEVYVTWSNAPCPLDVQSDLQP